MKAHTDATAALQPYAVAIAGEQAFDFAHDQIAKFRPGGANNRRLRDLQDAGEAMSKSPNTYAAAPDLLAALRLTLEWLESARADEPEDFYCENLDKTIDQARAALAKAVEVTP
jgi:hypothetical protein